MGGRTDEKAINGVSSDKERETRDLLTQASMTAEKVPRSARDEVSVGPPVRRSAGPPVRRHPSLSSSPAMISCWISVVPS